jgi:AcrR family transcriptional regulator
MHGGCKGGGNIRQGVTSKGKRNVRYKGVTRDEIKELAMELFLTKGYHGTSTAEICQELGISKPTLYWHFKNKEDVLFYAHQDLTQKLLIPILDRMKEIEDPLERLRYFIHEYVSVISKNPVLRLLVHENMFLKPEHSEWITSHWKDLLKLLRESLQQLTEQGRVKHLNDAFAALNLIGMCTWSYYWFDYSRPEGVDGLIKTIEEIFLKGILEYTRDLRKF